MKNPQVSSFNFLMIRNGKSKAKTTTPETKPKISILEATQVKLRDLLSPIQGSVITMWKPI